MVFSNPGTPAARHRTARPVTGEAPRSPSSPEHAPVPAEQTTAATAAAFAGSAWPAGPLDAAQRAFDLLTCPPAPLAFDCRGIGPGCLPQQIIGLEELRRLLIRDETPRPVRDLVWRELVIRARRDGPAWVIAAAGVAMPGLRRRAGFLARGWRGDRDDLDSELLAGFLERLTTIDVDADNICPRLIEAGARQVQRSWRHGQGSEDAAHDSSQWSLPPARPWDHPDFVLARAVAAAVIGPEECLLIAETRLDDVPLRVVAGWLGIPVSTASSWRRRGEELLREAVRDGELRWTHLSAAG